MRRFPVPIRFGIIGTGGIARAHAEALRADPRVRCTGVVDPVPGKAAKFLREHGFQQEFPTPSAMLSSPEIDAVAICAPPRLHAPLLVEALERGKAVICEKPVVLSLRELDECLLAEKRSGGSAGCVFQWRSGRGLRMLQQLQRQGLCGRLLWCNLQVQWFRTMEYYNVPWRGKWENESGGVAVTQSIHGIDSLLAVTGLPIRMTAHIATLNHDIEVEDYAAALLEFPSGARGTIQCSVDCRQERSHMLFGFEHVTAVSNDTPYGSSDLPWTFRATEVSQGNPLRDKAPAAPAQALQHHLDEIYRGHETLTERSDHTTQFRGFVTSLIEGTRPPVGLEDCRLSTQFLSGLYKSAMSGQTVDLPIASGDTHYNTWNGLA